MTEPVLAGMLDHLPDIRDREYQQISEAIFNYHTVFSSLYHRAKKRSKPFLNNYDEVLSHFDAEYARLTENLAEQELRDLLDSVAVNGAQLGNFGPDDSREVLNHDGKRRVHLPDAQIFGHLQPSPDSIEGEVLTGGGSKSTNSKDDGIATDQASAIGLKGKIRGSIPTRSGRGQRFGGRRQNRGRRNERTTITKTSAPVGACANDSAASAEIPQPDFEIYELSSPESRGNDSGADDPQPRLMPARTRGNQTNFAVLIDIPSKNGQDLRVLPSSNHRLKPPKKNPYPVRDANPEPPKVIVNHIPELLAQREGDEQSGGTRSVYMKTKLGVDTLVYRCMKARNSRTGVPGNTKLRLFMERNVRQGKLAYGKFCSERMSKSPPKARKRRKGH